MHAAAGLAVTASSSARTPAATSLPPSLHLCLPAAVLLADGKEAAAVQAVQAAAAAGGSSGIGEAELQLLAGKTYAQWRGHVPDALAVYDGLIQVGGVHVALFLMAWRLLCC